MNQQNELLYRDESYLIRGAVFEVYREMGCGFLEAVYQECLQREFCKQGIQFVSQAELTLFYKQEKLQQIYKADFICYGKIIVELKAAKELTNEHRAQLHNYLKATGISLGFLVNFGNYPKAIIERVVK
jgi:GxxExxY protein